MLAELLIMASVGSGPQVCIQPGDGSLSVAASHAGYGWYDVWQANRLTLPDPNVVHVGQCFRAPYAHDSSLGFSPSENTIAVPSSGTLSGIAATLGYNWHDIASYNGIKAPYVIHVGQILQLP